MLFDLLLEEQKKEDKLAYIGDTLWMISHAMNPILETPSFSQFFEKITEKPVEKEPTGTEIIDRLKRKLEEGGGIVESV